eukprot:TRINITY_DN9654_c0_g1_i1.p1 TRINITY_DN9654_c0_g1~~TRINITY_DN9654_c0_g1_i1.p1  ORF type:complete len:564 (+),score=148.36 TRINITY_DN9654_c0_g1_i1:85-1776(+)
MDWLSSAVEMRDDSMADWCDEPLDFAYPADPAQAHSPCSPACKREPRARGEKRPPLRHLPTGNADGAETPAKRRRAFGMQTQRDVREWCGGADKMAVDKTPGKALQKGGGRRKRKSQLPHIETPSVPRGSVEKIVPVCTPDRGPGTPPLQPSDAAAPRFPSTPHSTPAPPATPYRHAGATPDLARMPLHAPLSAPPLSVPDLLTGFPVTPQLGTPMSFGQSPASFLCRGPLGMSQPSVDGGDPAASSQGDGWSYYHRNFVEVQQLGSGCFGRVVRAQHRLDRAHYAVKISQSQITGRRDEKCRLREAQALARCSGCPYILGYYTCWIEDRTLYLQTELCEKGSVADALRREGRAAWEHSRLLRLFQQMCIALQYLHEVAMLVHLDVKPENIYVRESGDFRLGDFGLAAPRYREQRATHRDCAEALVLTPQADSVMSFEEGDCRYIPQDMLNGKAHPAEADVFSLGMSLHEVATGLEPSKNGESWHAVRDQGPCHSLLVSRGHASVSAAIGSMLRKDPSMRPSAGALLADASLWRCVGMSAADELSMLRAEVEILRRAAPRTPS